MGEANDDNAWRPPRSSSRPSEELDGYADLVEIGRGGDSVAYRARDLAVERDVAIKVLSVDDPSRAERFVREIEITVERGRQHPNIVSVLAIGTTAAGRPAIVMDFFERGSLHDQLRDRGPLAVDEAVAVGMVVATPSRSHTRTACCTATSSPRTCWCSRPRGCWPTSGSHGSSTPSTRRRSRRSPTGTPRPSCSTASRRPPPTTSGPWVDVVHAARRAAAD